MAIQPDVARVATERRAVDEGGDPAAVGSDLGLAEWLAPMSKNSPSV